MNKTKIDWADSTWNPVTGCLHGCEYCYARGIAHRFGNKWAENGTIDSLDVPARKGVTVGIGKEIAPYPSGFDPTFHRYRLDVPGRWTKPRNIFVCSMADLFGNWVPDEWIKEVFKACESAPQHNYIFLTKNPSRYMEMETEKKLPRADNFWFGSSVTKLTDKYTWFEEKKFHWFLSIEPLLEDLGKMNQESVKPEWVIIGAETGRRKDKVIPQREWIENIVNQCRDYGIPVFMKSSLETNGESR